MLRLSLSVARQQQQLRPARITSKGITFTMSQQSVIAPPVPFKEVGIAYLFWFFLGGLGAHKFYLRKKGLGIAYLFTLGFLGFGLLYDLFTLPSQVRGTNALIAHQANYGIV